MEKFHFRLMEEFRVIRQLQFENCEANRNKTQVRGARTMLEWSADSAESRKNRSRMVKSASREQTLDREVEAELDTSGANENLTKIQIYSSGSEIETLRRLK